MPQAVFAQFEVKSNLNRFDNQNRFHSKDSGIESDHSPKKTLFPAEPNLDAVRHELGKEGNLVNKAVWENTGLIPKFYKPYSLIETQDRSNPVPLYRCHFCKLVYKGHNSIVYHCRRHIGDYPYKCEECGFVEVCKSGLSSHMRRTGHKNCLKIDGPDRINAKTCTPTTKVTQLPDREEFASERIRDKSIKPKKEMQITQPLNVQANSCQKLTDALLAAGLHNLTRNENCEKNQEPSTSLALSSNRDSPDTCSNSPKSDNSEIEDTLASSAMGNDDKNDFSGIWETSEQRMNTLAPSLPEECKARVVGKNVGLIPKFLKPFSLIRGENGIPIYVCDYCKKHFRGHNSIVYHTRRHIGDYPYRCGTCGYAEVSKCALNQHHANHRHLGAILLRYSRHPTKTIEQIASEIKNEVAESLRQQEASKVAAMSRSPEFLRDDTGNMSPVTKKRRVEPPEVASMSGNDITSDPEFVNQVAGLFASPSDLTLTQKLEFLKDKLNRSSSPNETEPETSNIDEAPPLPEECKNKVINENCGLIPRHFKPFNHVTEENGVQLFKCNYCSQTYRGHNSIIYHCRRHIGDYPYRCAQCGFAEMSKAALNNHLAARRHSGCFVVRSGGKFSDTKQIKTVQNMKIQNQTGTGGLLEFTTGMTSPPLTGIESESENEDAPVPPPTGIEFLIWQEKKAEKRRLSQLDGVSWTFCGNCKSAFFNEKLFLGHLPCTE